jgi:hypothetical protein
MWLQWVVARWYNFFRIDHIHGDNTNNEVENLRYLCPNCHALTDTYRGKNKALKNKCVESIHQPPKCIDYAYGEDVLQTTTV